MGDYGGSSSASAAAELHLKMSKKIAQLTKVIFHLNTRNEDFQTEFAHLKQVHALEQQQLTQDAAAKLKLLTEQLQAHKDADARAARDKQQLLKDLSTFQHHAAQQQQQTQQEFQRRVAMLEEQVETSRRAFVDRIQQLTRMAEAQQRAQQTQTTASTTALQAAHRREIDEFQRAHSGEVEQVVMSSNAKFTRMLGEQLQLQDALRAELAAQRLQLEQQAENQRCLQQSQWQSERDVAQTRFDDMKQQLVGKMELLLADAETLRGHETRLRADKEELVKTQGDLQRQLKLMELQVSKAQHETQGVRKDSDVNTSKLLHTITASSEKIEQLTRELDALKTTLGERDAALRIAIKDRDALQLELLHGSASLSERHAQHAQQLIERDLKVANAQAELARQRQQATANEMLATQKLEALEMRVGALTRAIEELQTKLANAELLRASTQKDKDKTQSELKAKLADADKTIVSLRAEHTKSAHELQDRHTTELDALKTTHAEAVAKLRGDAEKRVADVEATLTQHSSASMEKALSEATQRHAKEAAMLRAAAEASEAQWMQRQAHFQAALQKLQTELGAKTSEAAEAQRKLSELTTRLSKCEAQCAQVTSDNEALKSAAQKTQKDRDEAFQRQLKELAAQHESALKRLTSEKDWLLVDHKQVLLQLAKDHADELTVAQTAWASEQTTQLTSQHDALRAGYEQQLGELKDQLERQRASAENAAQVAQDELTRLDARRASESTAREVEMARLTDRHAQHLVETTRSHQTAIETTLVAHAEEIERLTTKHKRDMDERQRDTTAQAEQRRTQLLTQHALALETLRQDHAASLTSQQDDHQTQRHSEALAWRAEMAQKLNELRLHKDTDHARAANEAAAVHATTVAALQSKYEALTASLVERSTQLDASQRACAALDQSLALTTREMHDRVASLERTNREALAHLKHAAKRDMDRLSEENVAETRALREQFEETQRRLSDHVSALTRSVAEWESTYARRESRAEDVARIAALERMCRDQDARVKQTLDEMAYFKRELLNREEMYNKTFARAPTVGVLQVLKPHVLRQAQMPQQQNNSIPNGPGPMPPPASASQSARRSKAPKQPHEAGAAELQRRGSERGTPGAVAAKKALPPLGNNNQAFGF